MPNMFPRNRGWRPLPLLHRAFTMEIGHVLRTLKLFQQKPHKAISWRPADHWSIKVAPQ